MNKNKDFSMENKYTFIDAFKCFFYLLITIIGVSFLIEIVLAIVAAASGKAYEDLAASSTVTIVSSLVSSLAFLIYYFVYNGCKKVSNRVALSDGQKKW